MNQAVTEGTVMERGIACAPESVRAIIEDVKTQTRRVVRDQPPIWADSPAICDCPTGGKDGLEWWHFANPMGPGAHIKCPYGRFASRLWVKERFRTVGRRHRGTERRSVLYPATCAPGTVKPPITSARHMPRWASRLTLLIIQLRIQRLQEITEADAMAEGVREVTKDGQVKKYCVYDLGDYSSTPWAFMPRTAVEAYSVYWNRLNAKRGCDWDSNPWVWKIEFKRLTEGRA